MLQHLLASQLKAYQQYHTGYWSKLTHFIGVPLIIFGLLTLTSWVHIRIPGFFDMPLSWLLSIIAVAYYFLLDMLFAVVIALVFIIFNIVISLFIKNAPSWLSVQAFLYTFIVGWVLQFIGHLIEKKKPALLDDLKQVLTAPLFLVAEVFFYFGKKQKLKKAMDELM